MSSIISVRNIQILYFSKKNKKIKNLKNGKKKLPNISIYTYCSGFYYPFEDQINFGLLPSPRVKETLYNPL